VSPAGQFSGNSAQHLPSLLDFTTVHVVLSLALAEATTDGAVTGSGIGSCDAIGALEVAAEAEAVGCGGFVAIG